MSVVAKRYAKAIALRADAEEFYANLRILASAFALPKFKILVESAGVKKEKKLELIQSFFEQLNPNFKNFLKILIENSRLSCVPHIVEELERQNAFKNNVFLGVVYTSEAMDEVSLKELEDRLSAKFNVKIKLSVKITQIDGVKVALEELGYELSFSTKTLQNKLSEFILKTI